MPQRRKLARSTTKAVVADAPAAKARAEKTKKAAAKAVVVKPKQTPFSRARWERNIANAQAKQVKNLGVPMRNVRSIVRERVYAACRAAGSDKLLTIKSEAMDMLVSLFLEFVIEHASELAQVGTFNCNMNPTESDRALARMNYMRKRGLLSSPNQTPFDQQAAFFPSRACRKLARNSKNVADYLLENEQLTQEEYEDAVAKYKQDRKKRANAASRTRRARKRAASADGASDDE